MITISMPLYFDIGKKKVKRMYINLNAYRNWHFIVSNNVKKLYKDTAYNQIKDLKFNNRIRLEFVLWKKDKRRIDRANPLSIHEKFFCDALTETGCIPDDNDEFIVSTTYKTGGIDKINPRVDIHIYEEDKVQMVIF